MTSGVYQITNQVNGHRYIGSSMNLGGRWPDHLSALRCGHHRNQHLQRAFDKYGEEAFIFEILECVETEGLIEREQYHLDTLNPEYNILPTAGSPLGHYCSLETRRRLSMSLSGERHPNYGKHRSQETRRKLSEANSGEQNPNYGKHHSAEAKQKISEALTGRHLSEEHRRKLSVARLGIRPSNYGKHLSIETRHKIRESMKEYWCGVKTQS